MTDLSKLGPTPEDLLLPAEARTAHIAGKAYLWSRTAPYGPLTLSPGYAPGDPEGCQAARFRPLAITPEVQVCTLHRGHATIHRHQPTLDTTPEWWGQPPRRHPNGAIAVPGLDGISYTYDNPAQQAAALASGDYTGEALTRALAQIAALPTTEDPHDHD